MSLRLVPVSWRDACTFIDAVLASEPMQAIRATLLEFAQFSAGDYNDKWAPYRTTTPRHELGDLPECVIDWVMEGNE